MAGLSTDAFVYLNLEHPLCAWATYRGSLVCPPSEAGFLSVWTASTLGADTPTPLNRELSLETVRQSNFPKRVSRLRGIFCFLDLQSAERAHAWGGHFRQENRAELHLGEAGPIRDRLDANWISFAKRDEHGHILDSECNKYWSGEAYPSREPIWETLIDGRAAVLGTDIRNRAYSIIKSKFPESLCFLEIGRLAGWMGYDLGNISAFLKDAGNDLELTYLMDMKDADKPEFLEALKQLMASDHPVNRADMDPFLSKGTFGNVPDLRPFGFRIPKPI
jgi:hypothetical protein